LHPGGILRGFSQSLQANPGIADTLYYTMTTSFHIISDSDAMKSDLLTVFLNKL
jgi:hypothetical protein